MIDEELVARKIALISRDLDDLKPLGEKHFGRFLENKIDQVAAERYLERTIGRMIDINYHVLTEKGQPPPPDYFQSFLKLADIGVLPSEFARQIAPSAGLRNRLVHEYDVIDPKKLYDSVRSAMRDIPVYLTYIVKLIDGD